MKIKIALLAIIAISFANCEKEDDNDYRNKFVGKYKCAVDTESETVSGGYFFRTYNNLYDTAVVSKTEDSSIIITTSAYKYQTEISEDGRFDNYYGEGMFVGVRLFFTKEDPSPGGCFKTIYYGKKIK